MKSNDFQKHPRKQQKKTAKIKSKETSVKAGYAVFWCCGLGLGFVLIYVIYTVIDVSSDALVDGVKQSVEEASIEYERARIEREAERIELDRNLKDLQRKLDAL